MSGADALEAVAARLGALVRREVPLGPLTTYRVGGSARLFAEVADQKALTLVADAVAGTGSDVLVVGRGSNLLVADAGFDGLVVVLGAGFADITIGSAERVTAGRVTDSDAEGGEVAVEAGGAVALPVLARATAQAGLTGLEWAVGVPGSVGGGVRMNAGGHGSDVAATLRQASLVDLASGEESVVSAGDLELGYRCSSVRPTQVVVSARFGLQKGDAALSAELIADIVRWRRANQPGGQNAGSVFANPPGDSAGRLIETAGCKGLRRGSAQVSPKHANFIQADPGGSARDVRALVEVVRSRTEAFTGVRLTTELRLVGFGPEEDPQATVEVEG